MWISKMLIRKIETENIHFKSNVYCFRLNDDKMSEDKTSDGRLLHSFTVGLV